MKRCPKHTASKFCNTIIIIIMLAGLQAIDGYGEEGGGGGGGGGVAL